MALRGKVGLSILFMATNDLMAELQKDSIKLDEDSENKVVTMLLKLLEDKNGEVQNLAVKCLGPLVGKVKEYQVETIVDTLCTNMLSDKEQLRDSSSMGLKTVIAELPPASTGSSLTANVCKKITAQLTGAISKQEDVSVQLEALDILSDMLSRSGSTLISFHSPILSCLLPQLTSPRLAVRKRAIIALSHLVPSCSAAIFTELMKHLLTELSRNESTSTTRTYIQCLAAISRQTGHRVGEHLEKIIPVLVKFCNVEDDELREYCFQAFESFVRRCPKEMSPHIPTVIGLCLKYITYDPNYNYDNDEEDDDNAMDTESGDEEDEETGDEYSDDDDMSWKVRRSSVKCLEAVMSTRHDMLQDFYKTVSPALIARFKEREENVKADIFLAYMALLKQTRPMQGWLQSSDIMGKEDSSLTMLKSQVPNVVKALHKQLKEKSIKSRQGCLCLLTELVNVLPGAMADHIPALIPGIVYSLTDKSSSSNMKIDSLSFLTVILCNHPPEALHPHIKVILPPVVACIGDPFYKITSEALLVTQQLVKVIRPLEKPSSFDSKPYVKDLFSSTLKRLKAADIDQEVKEQAISSMGQIICNLGDQLGGDLQPTQVVVFALYAVVINCNGDFLKTLQDPDLNVRRVALVMFNSAAHNKPSLIRDHLDSVLPHLYNETRIRKDLIREVEMGPFRHTVDDGLDVRKAAFECMYTLLDSCLDRLDIFEYLNHVEDGLKDHYDIRMLTFIMLARLSAMCPNAVMQRLDRLVEPLRATCTTKKHIFEESPQALCSLPPVVACIGDPFYKITSEALLVTQQLVKVIRPLEKPSSFDSKPYVKVLFSSTLKRLKAADIDQEVKEQAISSMGQIICNLGDQLGGDLQPTLKIFLERLNNEITRLTTVKTLTLIAGSSLKIDLRPVLAEGVPILASFLRKNHRALKLMTLIALDIIIKNYSDCLKPTMIESVLSELPSLIGENDMHISQVAIMLLSCLTKVCPSSLSKISGSALPEVFNLVHSPLLQGGAMNAILDFFQALVVTKAANMGFNELLKHLTGPFYGSQKSGGSTIMHRQSYYSVAKCVAALSSTCPKEAINMVNHFIQDVKNTKSSDSVRILAFLCLAEVGRTTNLCGQKELKTVILEAFSSPNEEVKSAASYALGNICVGNLNEYLPFMLNEIGSQPKRQYLLLHSLKEVISSSSAEALKPYVEDIWTLLFKHCECSEEGTRNVVAECLGKLTLVNPAQLLPRLKKQLTSGSPYTRSTVVTAIKFTITEQLLPIDALLKGCIGDFLKTLQDPDLNVRRVALVMFNSAAHNKPSLIRDHLDSVLPHLYNETRIRKDLIREVEMGPFRHTVDDGLDVRKAAFECMYTLLDSCLDRLDIFEYLNHVEDGLKDHYDIRMLTFIMLARLSAMCPNAVMQRLDRLVEPLRATCTTKVKAGSVKQEFEKQDELKRSAMRAVAALLTIAEAQKSSVMSDFTSQIRANSEMASIFESIQKDTISSTVATETMDTS
ncbi:UNVERIFIED_CONTAM: hypothetical protein FKN15_056135 [Acipenser sinensis]